MFTKLKEIWADLGRSIYDEKRLQSNMKGITCVSLLSILLGMVMLLTAFLELLDSGKLEEVRKETDQMLSLSDGLGLLLR